MTRTLAEDTVIEPPTKAPLKVPMPEGVTRVETGVIQFGTDWPSLHIRGDNAAYLGSCIRTVVAHIKELVPHPPMGLVLSMSYLTGLADMITGEVIVKPAVKPGDSK